jgi:hypothetical protein
MQAETKRSATAPHSDRELSWIFNCLLVMHASERALIWVGSHCTYNNTVRRSTRWISACKTTAGLIHVAIEPQKMVFCIWTVVGLVYSWLAACQAGPLHQEALSVKARRHARCYATCITLRYRQCRQTSDCTQKSKSTMPTVNAMPLLKHITLHCVMRQLLTAAEARVHAP